MTFFKSSTRFFGFSLSLPRFSVSFLCSMSYIIMTLCSQEKRLFQKRIPLSHLFLLCSYFRAHPTTLLLKILGRRMHGPSPPQILGDRPPRSPPLVAPPHYDDNHPSRFVFIFLRRFFPFPCSSFSSSSSAFAIIPRSVFLPHSAAPFSLHFLIRSSLLIRGLFASSFAPPLPFLCRSSILPLL